MDSFKNSVAFWTSVLGTFLGLLGALQSLTWLAGAGGLMVIGSIVAIIYARSQRQRAESAALNVAGRSVDSLNMASIRRRLNRSLVIQEVHNTATINGEDLTISWSCTGYCRADRETAMEFSIDSDNNVPFDELDCSAYDLLNDPRKRHRIRPLLVGPDGISKKIAVPFLAPLETGQPFDILLTCELPGCVKAGVEYYTATLSFDQDLVQVYTVRLVFLRDCPNWVRVYESTPPGTLKLLKDLRPIRTTAELAEYADAEQNVSAKSVRIYVFSRSTPSHMRDHSFIGSSEAAA